MQLMRQNKNALCCEGRDVREGQAPSYPQKEYSPPCRGAHTEFSRISSPSASWLTTLRARTKNITSRSFLKGWDQQFGRQLTLTLIGFSVDIISHENLALNSLFSTLETAEVWEAKYYITLQTEICCFHSKWVWWIDACDCGASSQRHHVFLIKGLLILFARQKLGH